MEERPVASWEKDHEADPRDPRCGRCGAATRTGDVRCHACGGRIPLPKGRTLGATQPPVRR